MKLRQLSPRIWTSDLEYAEAHAGEFDSIIGVTPQIALPNDARYHSIPVRDESTPTREELYRFVDIVRSAGPRILIHCQAGQSRSNCLGALARYDLEGKGYDTVLHEMHDQFMAEEPPHNWWPYEHWDKAIRAIVRGTAT